MPRQDDQVPLLPVQRTGAAPSGAPGAPPARAAGERTAEAVRDATDERILGLLCADGRMSMRTLAQRAGLSRAAAYARVQRLRDLGVITGATVLLDARRLGLCTTAHVHVSVEQRLLREALLDFRTMPEVGYCALLAGEPDVLLVVRAPDVDGLNAVLERLHRHPAVLRTRSVLVLEEVLPGPADLLATATAWSRAATG